MYLIVLLINYHVEKDVTNIFIFIKFSILLSVIYFMLDYCLRYLITTRNLERFNEVLTVKRICGSIFIFVVWFLTELKHFKQ